MSFAEQNAAKQPEEKPLRALADDIVSRLQNVTMRLDAIVERVHGSQRNPPAVAATTGAIQVQGQPALSQSVEHAHSWLSNVESAIGRIESGL
jgi:hypothetical protein